MKRVLITRPPQQGETFAAELRNAGFEPVFFPMIRIEPMEDTAPLDDALQELDRYDWLIFTSVNAVQIVWNRLTLLGRSALPSTLQVAVIGPKTAAALEQHGIQPAFVPTEYVAEAILPGLGELQGKKVLLPRAEIARKTLPRAIEASGGIVHEIPVYRTIPLEVSFIDMQILKDGVDIVALTSPSIVHSFAACLRQASLDPADIPGNPLIACIGPITARAAKEMGFSQIVIAASYTIEGLVDVIEKAIPQRAARSQNDIA